MFCNREDINHHTHLYNPRNKSGTKKCEKVKLGNKTSEKMLSLSKDYFSRKNGAKKQKKSSFRKNTEKLIIQACIPIREK